jgi:plastocyanin
MPNMKNGSWIHRIGPGLLVAAALAVPANAPAATWEVVMGSDDLFHPELLTIALGDSVYWTNEDLDNHTATSGSSCTPDGRFDSGDVGPGQSWGYLFDEVGTFPYYCLYHCVMGMVGTITVQEGTATDERTWGSVKSLYR